MSAPRFSGTTPDAAHQAHRRSQADQRLVRGRTANRVAGVARERRSRAKFAAAPAAEPPLDPAVTRLVSYGLRV